MLSHHCPNFGSPSAVNYSLKVKIVTYCLSKVIMLLSTARTTIFLLTSYILICEIIEQVFAKKFKPVIFRLALILRDKQPISEVLLVAIDIIVNYQAPLQVAVRVSLREQIQVFNFLPAVVNATLFSAKYVTEVIALIIKRRVLFEYLIYYLICKGLTTIVEKY